MAEQELATKPKRGSKAERTSAGTGQQMVEAEPGTQMVGDGSGTALPPADRDSYIVEAAPGELEAQVESLGESVRRAEGAAVEGVDLSEAAHNRAIEESERIASEWTLNPASLIADVRDFQLEQIKRRPKPWSATSPAEQRDVAAACEHSAQELVRKVVEVLASRGKKAVRVFLTKVVIAEDIQIAGKVKPMGGDEEDEAVALLHHARGKHVMLTVASKDDYAQEHREAETDEEEPPLPFEAGAEEMDDRILAGEDLVTGSASLKNPDSDDFITGELCAVPDHGLCVVRVNLKTGMVEAQQQGSDDFEIDVRQATPAELAAERERIGDFTDDELGDDEPAD